MKNAAYATTLAYLATRDKVATRRFTVQTNQQQ